MNNDEMDENRLSKGVVSVGLASFFSDAGHEITTSVLPAFLISTLHASASTLGLIEGIADALMGVMKVVGGTLANDPGRRGKLASGGYIGTALATGAIGMAMTVWQVGALRAGAWLSRGLRSPARDAMLASFSQDDAFGKTYGIERMGDNLGAVVGPVLASLLVSMVGVRNAMFFSVVPGLMAAVSITVAAREARRVASPPQRRPRFEFGALRQSGLLKPMIPIGFFEFGNIATTLLILRATQLLSADGRSTTSAASLAILIYAAHNVFAALIAVLGGMWIDKAGPRIVFGSGAFLYVLAYLGFAASFTSWIWILLSFILAGSAIGLSETAESALVAHILPDHLRGSGFGILGGVQSLGDLVSTVIVGLLYSVVSPAAGFAYAAGWMILAWAATIRGRLFVEDMGPET